MSTQAGRAHCLGAPLGGRLFPESYERFIGIYWGQVSTPFCAETVEASDAYLCAWHRPWTSQCMPLNASAVAKLTVDVQHGTTDTHLCCAGLLGRSSTTTPGAAPGRPMHARCDAGREDAVARSKVLTAAGCARGSVGYSLLIKEEKMIKVPSCPRCASCALIGEVRSQATGPQCLPAWRCAHAPVCVPCWSVQSLSRVMQSNPNPIRTWARVTAGVQRAALARRARRAEQACAEQHSIGVSLPSPTS